MAAYSFLHQRHNGFHSFSSCRLREQFVADIALVADLLKSSVYPREINLAGAGLMTAGGVRDVDMAEGIAKVFDRVTDAAFIDLHVISQCMAAWE